MALDPGNMEPSGLQTAILVLLILLPGSLIFLQIRIAGAAGTDQRFHFTLIDQIRRNRNRFVLTHDFFMLGPNFIYPQLMHWLLSFLPEKAAMITGRYISAAAIVASSVSLTVFSAWLHTHLPAEYAMEKWDFVTVVLAIYTLTPYSYHLENAKNVGMSGRAIGLLLCEWYVYCMVVQHVDGAMHFLILAAMVGFVILMINTFAMQFMLLSAPVFALLTGDPGFIYVPLAAIVLFVVTMPRYAIAYARGQLLHKRTYRRYFAGPFLLKPRPGIWRDLVWDFWRIVARGLKCDSYGGSGLKYIFFNPVVLVLIGFPALGAIVVARLQESGMSESTALPDGTALVGFLMAPILACMVLFVATSFRWTRFLGEPERYVEISTSFMAIVATLACWSNDTIIGFLLSYSAVCVLLQTTAAFLRAKRKSTRTAERTDPIDTFLSGLEDPDKTPLKILSNNLQIAKSLISTQRTVFFGFGYPDTIAGLPMAHVAGSYPMIAHDSMGQLAKELDIRCLVIDTRTFQDHRRALEVQGLQLDQVHEENDLIVYRADWS